MSRTRRDVLVMLPLSALALPHAHAQAMVDEADATAKALGYLADASKIDKAKQPKYVAGQQCAGCQLFQGKAGAAAGPCALFPGKQVSAKGWCISFVKKT